MDRRVYLASVGAAGLAALAGCSSPLDALGRAPCDGDDCDVGMTRHEFVPERYEARVGEPVVWKNTSEADHTVTAYEGSLPAGADFFASGGYPDEETARDSFWESRGGRLGTRETYEHTFDVPGTYSYFCVPHEVDGRGNSRMIGLVDVVE